MRVLGVDFGRKRVGLAVSDDSALLARPWKTIPASSTPAAIAADLALLIAGEGAAWDSDGPIGLIVVGLPKRLNGDDTDETKGARELAAALGATTGLRVHLQDERLTSKEAESRLARTERDWRRRKEAIDAMAAAIILQDFLDVEPGLRSATPTDDLS